MRKNSNNPTKATSAAAQMPRLRHQLPDQEFDYAKSEVLNWLVRQPAIRQAMFDYYRGTESIVFDKETGTWHGQDFQTDPQPHETKTPPNR